MAESDTAFGEIVGGKFEGDFVAGQNANAVSAEAAGQVGQTRRSCSSCTLKSPLGNFSSDGSLYFNAVFFTHSPIFGAIGVPSEKSGWSTPGHPLRSLARW